MKIKITDEIVRVAAEAFDEMMDMENKTYAMRAALEAAFAMLTDHIVDATEMTPPQPACGCREALRSIEDMIIHCADVPRNPDSLPMTVLQTARTALASPECGCKEGWQLIETLPENHQPVLAWSINTGQIVAFKDINGTWYPRPATKPLDYPPTYWAPLRVSPNIAAAPLA
jgi:hypothetical protein